MMRPVSPPAARYSLRLRFVAYWLGTIGLWLALHNRFSTAHGSGTLGHLEHLWTAGARFFGLSLRYPGEWFIDHNLLVPAVVLAALFYAGCLSALWWRRASFGELLAWAALAGLPFIFSTRFQSTDISDYLLRARMQFVYHLNPFVYSGHYVPFDPFFYTSSWPQVRWVYGPLYLLFLWPFALVERPVLAGLLLRGATFSIHLVNGYLLWKALPSDTRRKSLLTAAYLLSPLLFIESAGNAHNDFFMIFFILAAVHLDRRGKTVGASIALAGAFLIKLYAVPTLVCFCAAKLATSRRAFVKAALPATVVIALFYVPFWAGPSILTAPFDGGSSKMLVHSLLSVVRTATNVPEALLIKGGLVLTMLFIGAGAVASLRHRRWEAPAAYAMFFWCTVSSGWFWPWYVAAPVALAFVCEDRPIRWGAMTLLITDLAFYMEPTSWHAPLGASLSVRFLVFFLPISVVGLVWRLRHDALAHRVVAEWVSDDVLAAVRNAEAVLVPVEAITPPTDVDNEAIVGSQSMN